MTVSEILKKYRGGFQESFQSSAAKLWGHDLKDQYDPNGIDYVTDLVIADIEAGRVEFDFDLSTMSKAGYKKGMKEYRTSRKESRAFLKKYRKDKRKQK